MSDWNLELPNVKAKRRGIVEQKPVVPAKKKKFEKPWRIEHVWSLFGDFSWRSYGRYKTKEDAERAVEKHVRRTRTYMTVSPKVRYSEAAIIEAENKTRSSYRIVDTREK